MGLFGAVLGAVAERLERRRALIFVVLAMMASSAAVAILATLGRPEVWALAAAALVHGLGWATDNPIHRMMIGAAADSHRLGPAQSAPDAATPPRRPPGPPRRRARPPAQPHARP